MGNAYVEVFRTYWRRLWSSIVVILYTVVTLAMIAASLMLRHGRPDPAIFSLSPCLGIAVLCMAMVSWAHFHEQVASERRRLWPNYARPHIVVFAVIAGVFVIGWPLAVNGLQGTSGLGLLAVTTSLFALVGWFAAAAQAAVLILAVVAQMALMIPPVAEVVFGGQYERMMGGLLGVALVASVFAVIRMLRLTEGDRGYGRTIQIDTRSLKPRMTGEGNRVWSQQKGLFGPSSGIFIPVGTRLWERARRWRSLNGGAMTFGAVMGTAMLAGPMFMARAQRANMGVPAQLQAMTTFLPLFYVSVILPLTISQSWLRFWRYLEADSLRTLDRRSFLQEIGLAMTVQTMQCWGILAGLYVVMNAWVYHWHVEVASTTAFVALSLGLIAFELALAMWFLRYRSQSWSLVPALFGGVAIAAWGVVTTYTFSDGVASRAGMVIGAVLLTCLSVVIMRSAYRKWLVTELG